MERTIQKDLTDAIEITVDVDFGLRPARYREELVRLMQSVA